MLLSKKNNFFLVFFFVVETLFSQHYPSIHYSTLNGLSNNSVYSVLKDSRGLLWVGTANGVSLIKHGVIQNFQTSDGLAHNSCWAIAEDRLHNLWFGSYGGGLTFYDGKQFQIINTTNGLVNDKIRTLFVHGKYLYVGTQYGFSVVDVASRKVVYSDKIKGEKGMFQVMNFYIQKGKVFFATFDDGIWSIDLSKKQMLLENHTIPHIFSIHQTKSNLYFSHIDINNGYFNQMSIYNSRSKLLNRFRSETIIWDYVEDKRGSLYAAGNGVNYSNGGLYQLTPNKLREITTSIGIPSYAVWSLDYDDRKDLLYVGTLDKGLYVIDLKRQIDYYSPSFFNKEKLEVVKMERLNSTLLVLSSDELLLLKDNQIEGSIKKKTFFDYLHQYKLAKGHQLNPDLYDFFKKTSYKDFELKDVKVMQSKVWVNSTLGLFKLSHKGELLDYYPFPIQEFYFINKDKLIYQERYGNFWEVNNLSKDFVFKEFKHSHKNDPRDGVQIINLLQKQFILSAFSGLYSYQNGQFFSYAANGLWNEKELVCGTVDSSNNLIVATSVGDVYVLDVSNGFRVKEKIPAKKWTGKSISFLHSYKKYLIIGNEKGIIIYKNGQVRLIDEEQGLSNKIITSSQLNGDKLHIGTTQGFYILNLNTFINTPFLVTDLKLTDVEVNYQPISKKQFKWFSYNFKIVELPYDQNTISIKFEPKHALYPGKLSYRYQLKGIENAKWSNWNQSKEINLTYLPSGEYIVQVEVKDFNFGTVSLTHLLNIIVQPPFWKTWWFIIISLFLIGLISVAIIKIRIARITRQEKDRGIVQKRLVETKMEALQSQMNPHFIFNAMNSIQNYILDNNVNKALMYMGEFSKLIRQTLNNSSKIRINLEDEINYLQLYTTLENLRFNNQITIQIQVNEFIDLSTIEIPPMLIQPFVENVFVHAFNSKSLNPQLQISFQLESDFLVCEIKDNGKGMLTSKSNELSQSRGIQLVRERLSLLQGDASYALTVFSFPNQGTKVLIRIKLE
jgi:hypothetical protein